MNLSNSSFHSVQIARESIELPGSVLNNLTVLLLTSTVALISLYFLRADPLAHIPILAAERGDEKERRALFLKDAKSLYLEGRKKFGDGVYQITTSRHSKTIVVPTKFLEELRKLPDDTLCNQCAADETLESKYTRLNTHEPVHGHVLKTSLTPSLRRMNPRISAEIDHAVHANLPSQPAWTSVNIHHALLRIVASATGCIGIGAPLCRDDQYLAVTANYAGHVMAAGTAASRVPLWLRPVLAPRLPEVKKLDALLAEAEAFMRPVIEERKRGMAEGKPAEGDLLQWMLETDRARFGLEDDRKVVTAYLGFVFAAIHSTTVVATNILYSLAAMRDFIPELREEIRRAVDSHGGVLSFEALQKMMKLDSVMKESMRLYPLQHANFQRKVLRPFTLSTSVRIPGNTVLEFPTVTTSLDPSVFPDPHTFDPLRFYRIRTAPDADHSSNQFVTVSADATWWGWGSHACPGRFFAANEIKMVVAQIVLEWDVKMPGVGEGEALGSRELGGPWGEVGRWRNWEVGNFCFPDPTKELLFQRIMKD
ncbi:Cytochrome P450 [Macrophomina phaseolina MS6]|uniref:Cytochrome P450 n=1 Tax=Macrophomina phaseolina (strain MS6) TaxID=1126212 RepID=K2RW34_MACPH|nr:Cytochrome P450 [Macrophomina phaseolina MS6]